MNNIFKIKDRFNNDSLVDVKLISLAEDNVDDFMKFQDKIIEALDSKELYAPTSREEFIEYTKKVHYIIGIINIKSNELIAVGIYIKQGLINSNYGYDLDYLKVDIENTSQIESTLVLPQYRGNKLQKLICKKFIEKALENKDKYIAATVSPINPYSLNSFLDLGFENIKEKLKYGGLRRCILSKKL